MKNWTSDPLFIIDISSFIFRAYYGIGPLTSPTGVPTNAVYGVLTMIERLFKEYQPKHLCACFDSKAPSFRKSLFPEYKANREAPPEELAIQIPMVRELVDLLKIAVFQKEGIEADDIIATLVLDNPNRHHVIVTGDKDLFQLVNQKNVVIDTMKNIVYDEAAVADKLGVHCHQVADYLSLVGDSSDNVPGVAGIGPKTAVELLLQFGSLEGIYQNLDKLAPKRREKFIEQKEKAYLSQQLVKLSPLPQLASELHSDCPVPTHLSAEAKARFLEWGFSKIVTRLFAQPVTAINTEPRSPETSTAGTLKLGKINPAGVLNLWQGPQGQWWQSDGKAYSPYDGQTINHGVFWSAKEFLRQFPDKLKQWDDLELIAYLLQKDRIHLGNLSESSPATALESITQKASLLKSELALVPSLVHVYETIDKPLIPILAAMEAWGVLIDRKELANQETSLMNRLVDLKSSLYSLAGEEFNPDSPKQVAALFFDRMGIPPTKKTKTGYSTDAEVLEELSAQYPIAKTLLEYREIAKLLSTYVQALPQLTDDHGRLHCRFNQTVAATGRLSSSQPNLQNIPIRTPDGHRVRKAFIAPEGHLLVSADYSQIELRILAHYTQDPGLMAAFLEGRDVHQETAKAVFGGLNDPTADQRRIAKTINFGLMYGQGPMGLSKQLGISMGQAKTFIEQYFSAFPKVRSWMDQTIADAKQTGQVATLFGRVRQIPELLSQNQTVQKSGGRMAINTPIQGTAADLIKLAMIRLSTKLPDWKARLVLQVHDELVLECPQENASAVLEGLIDIMQTAYQFSIPIVVDGEIGPNWYFK